MKSWVKSAAFGRSSAVTAELSIEYLKPVGVNQEIVVEAFESDEPKGQEFFMPAKFAIVRAQFWLAGAGVS